MNLSSPMPAAVSTVDDRTLLSTGMVFATLFKIPGRKKKKRNKALISLHCQTASQSQHEALCTTPLQGHNLLRRNTFTVQKVKRLRVNAETCKTKYQRPRNIVT